MNTASTAQTPVIALIGAGLMGRGLARIFRGAGWPVSVWDQDAAALEQLCREVPGTRAGRDLADTVRGAVLVIEAIVEKAEIKQALFEELASLSAPATLLATNSSVIPVATVAARVPDEDAHRVLGTHFWNPPDLIPLVEVIQGPRTAPASVERVLTLLKAAGKEPVHVHRDVVPGNRLQHALWREAMALVDEGICSPQDVDHIIKRSFGARLAVLGPLENADLVGLELTRQIHEVVLPSLSRAIEPSPGLKARLIQGHTGIASGQGFYSGWTDSSVGALRARLTTHLRRIFSADGMS
jgi:3-hydroxybutyryl-CoA dehydrogenase